jgi:WD40 repeat protein
VLWAGDTLASCCGDSVDVHDASAARHVTTLGGHHDAIQAMALSTDGSRLMSASADGEIRLWHVPSGRELFVDAAHVGGVECCGFFESGAFAFSASKDGMLKLWRVDPPGLLRTLSGHAGWVHAAAVLAGDRFVLSGSKAGFVQAWRVETGTPVAEHWAGASVLSLAVDRSGRYVAAGDSNGQVHLLALVNAPDVEPL